MSAVVLYAAAISLGLIVLALCIALVRLVRGPFLVDRALVLDLISFLLMAACGAYAVKDGNPALFDVAIIVALAGMLGTLAFARHLSSEVDG